jgi:hypothetical protein
MFADILMAHRVIEIILISQCVLEDFVRKSTVLRVNARKNGRIVQFAWLRELTIALSRHLQRAAIHMNTAK